MKEVLTMIQRMLAVGLLGAAFAATALPAYADPDRVQFGSNINVASDESVHDAVCFFCSVNIQGKVSGDVVVFFGNVHIVSEAHHDVVNFFGKVAADDNASVGHDLVSMFGRVQLGENVTVSHDVVAMFGTLRESGSATAGNDHVVMPAWLFFGPLGVVVLVVILIVHELRASRRRAYLRIYNFPPGM
jgi:hypothetical protein